MLKGQTLTPCDSTPANCIWNLYSGIIFTDIDSANCLATCTGKWLPITYGTSTSVTDVTYTDDVDDSGHACHANTDGCTATLSSLYYYVYFPKHNYTYTSGGCNSKLPCIILFHAGGYSDCSSVADGDAIKLMAREYAYRGFIAVVAEYRRGKVEDPNNTVHKYTSAQKSFAYDRGITDGRGVVRNVIYRENNWGSLIDPPPYRIDIHKIFLGGMSAGAGIAINVAYYRHQSNSYDQLDNILPGIPLVSDLSILGPVNQAYYDCGSCGYDYFSNANILGVMSCWGGALLPLSLSPYAISDVTPFFSHNSNIPAFIGWHGKQDPVINYDHDEIYFSPSSHSTFHSITGANACLIGSPSATFTVADGNTPNSPDLHEVGSSDIYNFFTGLSPAIPAQLYLDSSMHHGVHTTTDDFSCGASTTDDIYKYIVKRSATFFQSVMLHNPSSNSYTNTINTSGPSCPPN